MGSMDEYSARSMIVKQFPASELDGMRTGDLKGGPM